MRRGFDGRMFVVEVEESAVFDITPAGENDESMMMRTGEVFLTGFVVTFGIFVVFFADDDVDNTVTREFVFEEFQEFLIVKISVGVGHKYSSGANTKFSGLRHVGEKGGV